MKEQLLRLYREKQSEFISVRQKFSKVEMNGPFLISPNDKYEKQIKPFLIVGQETKGWGCHVDEIEKQMEVYEHFNLGEKYYASPFWNITRKIEKALGSEYYSCAWTNISKYDVDERRADGEYEVEISTLDRILLEEIQILKPKVCLFYTGPSFDHRVKNIFAGIEFLPIGKYSLRQFCQLKHKDLPLLTFRSYHPNYLRRSGKENEFIKLITELAE